MPDLAAEIRAQLLSERFTHGAAPFPASSGLMAFYVVNGALLLPVMTEEPGLVFVGMVERGENPFIAVNSGFSPLRRSLGAILKERLSLTAKPRGAGASIANIRNFVFTEDGEARLSAWMQEHLRYGFYGMDEAGLVEKDVIRLMRPPLCLNGWTNRQSAMIRRMRKVCADEAWQVQRA